MGNCCGRKKRADDSGISKGYGKREMDLLRDGNTLDNELVRYWHTSSPWNYSTAGEEALAELYGGSICRDPAPQANPARPVVVVRQPQGTGSSGQSTTRSSAKACEACGKLNHRTEDCRYFTRLCFYCRDDGHIISICPKRKRSKQRKQAAVSYKVSALEPKNKFQAKRVRHYQTKHRASGQQKRQNGTTTKASQGGLGDGWAHQPHGHLPPGMGRKPRTPVRTLIAFGSVENLRNDDALKRDSGGCSYLMYAVMCCI